MPRVSSPAVVRRFIEGGQPLTSGTGLAYCVGADGRHILRTEEGDTHSYLAMRFGHLIYQQARYNQAWSAGSRRHREVMVRIFDDPDMQYEVFNTSYPLIDCLSMPFSLLMVTEGPRLQRKTSIPIALFTLSDNGSDMEF